MHKINSISLRKCIQQIERLNIESVDHSYLLKLFQNLTMGYFAKISRMSDANIFYRAIKRDKTNEISGVSYPPAHLVKAYGRGNYINQPVFYCSIDIHGSLAELSPAIGDTFVISRWRSTTPFLLNHIGYTEEIQELLCTDRPLDKVHTFVQQTREHSELNSLIYEYMGEIFNRKYDLDAQHLQYKLSSVLCNHLIASPDFQGLIYPSVKDYKSCDNFLFKTNAVDMFLKLQDVIYCEIKAGNSERFFLRIFDYGRPCNEHKLIVWDGPEWQDGFGNYIERGTKP